MTENEQRAAFVREARSWLGTPFRDQGDVKGKTGAADCAMLLVRSAQACGLIDPAFDPRPYPPQWHLHRDEERFLKVIAGIIAARGHGAEIANCTGLPSEALAKEGDVIVWRVARCFAHGGIVIENNQVLHAYYKTGQVAISSLNEVDLAQLPDGRPRPFKLFDLWSGASPDRLWDEVARTASTGGGPDPKDLIELPPKTQVFINRVDTRHP